MQAQSIAVGIVINQHQQVLISKRRASQHLSGCWEFPGGKVEKDESFKSAMRRELLEEIGICVETAIKLVDIQHSYQDRQLHLQFFKVLKFSGEVSACENQLVRWVELDELKTIQFPPANQAVIDALILPTRYMIADENFFKKSLASSVRKQLERGVRIIQHRAIESSSKQAYLKNAAVLKEMCDAYNAYYVINCPFEWLDDIKSNYIHLTSKLLRERYSRKDALLNRELFSVSCHDEDEVNMANELNARCVLIGAVNRTNSHPNRTALGWKRFSQLCFYSNAPVYALGGMSLDDHQYALLHGAQGIAAIRAFAV